ncbi:hypothetical protein Pyn_01387 [Prunus yedoensis var. nudiflora]|uniref:Uncharacterized protein n=1 Tax=Prunus yedoensis var. nudiflora TaxID=2094558 RepID=A0A314UXG0_PRUYE|nr:hypothetical protein Pyn_01387 [Prunus yedoensis var. nudiflora]
MGGGEEHWSEGGHMGNRWRRKPKEVGGCDLDWGVNKTRRKEVRAGVWGIGLGVKGGGHRGIGGEEKPGGERGGLGSRDENIEGGGGVKGLWEWGIGLGVKDGGHGGMGGGKEEMEGVGIRFTLFLQFFPKI